MTDSEEAKKKKKLEDKLKKALKAKAAEVHPKGTEADIQAKIAKKKKKGK